MAEPERDERTEIDKLNTERRKLQQQLVEEQDKNAELAKELAILKHEKEDCTAHCDLPKRCYDLEKEIENLKGAR